MPTGYEARQGGRNSFANEGISPVQTSTGASADSRGAQQVGGESIGGVEGGQWAAPAASAFGLGQFFERFMEPTVERKQQEQFFKGYTEAQSGRALEELTDNDSPLTQIFGPSGFAQGAQFFHAQSRIDQWTQDTLADTDNLKRMAPPELAKYMAETAQSMLTGDPYADQHIQAGLLEAQAPVIQTIAKERFKWQQNEMVEQQSSAAHASAGAFQTIAAANAALGEGADVEAIQIAGQRFAGIMQKPDGMTDENYQKFLSGFLKRSMQEGNFYAVELLRSHGVTEVLTEDQLKGVEDAYERYGNRALDEAAQEPDITQRLLTLDARVAQAEMDGEDAASVADVVAEYRSINEALRVRTGMDKDFFDAEDIRSGGGRVISAIVSRFKRAESRANALEDRNWNAQQRASEKADEAAARVAGARTAWGTGQVTAAIAEGMQTGDFDTLALQDYSKGDYSNIQRAFVQSGYVSTPLTRQVQAAARSAVGTEYSKATEASFQLWKQMHEVNPELSSAYFGEYDYAFQTFQMLLPTSGPEIAYRDAFAKVGGYSVETIPAARRKEHEAEMESLLSDTSGGWVPWKWGNYTLSEVGRRELGIAIGAEFTRAADAGSSRSTRDLVRQAYNSAIRDGRFEQYGVLGWRNTRPGPTLASQLGLQGNDAHVVIQAAVAKRLEEVGVGDMETARIVRTPSGLIIEYMKDGVTKHATADMAFLKRVASNYVERRRRPNIVPTPTGAQRFVSGRSVWPGQPSQ